VSVAGSISAGIALAPVLAIAGLTVLAIGAASVGERMADRSAADALNNRSSLETERVGARMDEIGEADLTEELRRELYEITRAIAAAGSDYSLSRAAADRIHALSVKTNKACIEASQRTKRAEAVLKTIEEIKAFGPFSEFEQLARIKTERIEKEIARVGDLEPDDRMAEMQRMLDELGEVRNSRELAALSPAQSETPPQGEGGAEERDRLVTEIRDLANRIADLDDVEGERAAEIVGTLSAETRFPDRLRAIKRQLRTTLAAVMDRAALSAYFRETLAALREELERARGLVKSDEASRLISRCDAMRGGKYIDRPDFMALYEAIMKFAAAKGGEIADSLLAARVKEALSEMGYDLVEDEAAEVAEAAMEPGRVNYLETPYDGYRVMAKVGGGELSARLVRVTDADEPETAETAENQAALDREAGQKWCGDFDEFLARMRDAGLPIDVSLRREPDEAEVIATPVKGAKKKKSARKSRARGSQTEGRMRARDGENE
jgi:hypothetical protein